MRLFFALPCPEQAAEKIVDWRARLFADGRLVDAGNFHLTLAFLGNQPEARLPELMRLAGSIRADSFDLKLDQLTLWPSGLLHLAPSASAALLALAAHLQAMLSQRGIAQDQCCYQPHLTLARDCQHYQHVPPAEFAWRVSEFCLYLSLPEGDRTHYRRLASWPLAACRT